MPTVSVSTNAQLSSALKSATADTTIQLNSGTYSLDIKNADFHGATITEAAGATASFSQVTFYNVANVTFDGVDFVDLPNNDRKLFVTAVSSNVAIRNSSFEGVTADGYGDGVAVWVNKTTGFTLQNTSIHEFSTGAWLGAMTDLTVSGNHLSDIAWDGMIVGGVHDAVFADNDISLNVPAARKHTDGMQFYNTDTNNPLTNVNIHDNHIETHNKASHGIYMGNALADASGDPATFFRNITLQHNTIISGQVSGIAAGQTDGLVIRGNVILQDTSFYSAQDIGTPVIRVNQASTNVSITDNYTHKDPAASTSDWYPVKSGVPSGWTVSDNHLVPLGTTPDTLPHDPVIPQPGNGQADLFRLDAIGPTDVVDHLDFTEGDVIELYNYKGGTFHAQKGGNDLVVTVKGAILDSIADLRELTAASPAVHISDGGNDTLVIDIDQPAGVHSIQLTEVAHLYFDVA